MKYFVAMAYDAGLFGQSDYMHLIKMENDKIAGCSTEFDVCTFDITEACSADSANTARWFKWNDSELRAASFEEIKKQGLVGLIKGYKNNLKINSDIEEI